MKKNKATEYQKLKDGNIIFSCQKKNQWKFLLKDGKAAKTCNLCQARCNQRLEVIVLSYLFEKGLK